MRITPEAVQLFMASEKHADVYSECIGGGPASARIPAATATSAGRMSTLVVS